MVRSMRTERGGSISTLMTKRPSVIASARPRGRGRLDVGARAADRSIVSRGGVPARQRRFGNEPRRLPRADRRSSAGASPHVGGSRTAATADDPRARGKEAAARHRAKYDGPGGVDELALDACGKPALGMIERGGRRSFAAISTSASRQTSGPTPQFTPRTSTPARRAAAPPPRASCRPCSDEIFAEGHRGEHRQVGRRRAPPRSPPAARQVRERLEHEQVDAALQETLDLFAKCRPNIARRGRSGPWIGPPPARPSRQ